VTATVTFAPGTALGGGHVFHVTTTNPDGIARNSNNLNIAVLGATVTFTGPVPALTTAGAGTATTKAGVVTVRNGTGGNAGPFTFTAAPTIALASGVGTFTITGGTCAAGTVLAPGGSCTINVQDVPPATAPFAGRATVTVTGTGLASANGTATFSFNAN
jgi:hypothetical protein